MRLMAVLDWWEIIRDFIMNNADVQVENDPTSQTSLSTNLPLKPTAYISGSTGVVTKYSTVIDAELPPYELKLNITDSEIVVVEDTSVWDTNAIILKVLFLITNKNISENIMVYRLIFFNFFRAQP